ncbi:MAG: 3-deoxy-7-phosphoheptulonate synthase [Propionibacteriaceae bacterium]
MPSYDLGSAITLIAGPCAVETPEQTMAIATAVAAAGATMLRGGVFKPRTSPRSFQGLGAAGLEILAAAGAEVGLPIITEVLDTRDVELVARYATVLQIGSRNMQNFALLKEVGRSGHPVMLKRGLAATYDEWLGAVEYLTHEGNDQIVLCERGIRTFEPSTRNTLDLAAVPLLQQRTGFPVVVDPSHGTGRVDLIAPMSLAAVAAGADGIMIEVHDQPEQALSDGQQALSPAEFEAVATRIAELRAWLNR